MDEPTAARKHPDCDPCPCGSGEEHCKHAHQPWFALTDDETAILDFERHWWKYPGAKEQAIRDTFGCSPTRHYQLVNAIIDKPAALAYDPLLVRRLIRLRDARAGQRSSRRLELEA